MMPKEKTETIYSINKEISHREIEGQILLLRPDDHFLYTLNGSGKFIWLEIIKHKPVSTITKNLSRRFNIPGEKAVGDVLRFVKDLEKKGIIVKAKNR